MCRTIPLLEETVRHGGADGSFEPPYELKAFFSDLVD